jgi:CRISPR-associated protein Csm1
MEERVLNAAIAGLLHDVGKFALRAGQGNLQVITPQTRQEVKSEHALRSQWFFDTFVTETFRQGNTITGVAYHHKPQNDQSAQVKLADQLSSSESEQDEDQLAAYLQSIFSKLGGHQQPAYHPLKQLNPRQKNKLFPKTITGNIWKESVAGDYARLWEDFTQESKARGLSGITDRGMFIETMLVLLQQFAWCIPTSVSQHTDDISLYDHSRTTAALTACLAADGRDMAWCSSAMEKNAEICVLVGADLSGLQNFIYSLASSGAAKSIRARSFYIQMLADILALRILEDLDLPITNLLYVGGGGFQLIAPMRDVKKLPAIIQNLTDRLLTLHQGALGLAMGWVIISAKDFERFNLVQDRLGKLINRAKRKPFASASSDLLFSSIGEPLTTGGDPLRFCHVTGEDGDNIARDEDGEYKSKFVLSLEALGRVLPRAKHIILTPAASTESVRAVHWQQTLEVFGYKVQIVTDKKAEALQLKPGQWLRIWRLDPQPDPTESEMLQEVSKIPHVVGYRPFARLTPLDQNGLPKTTDDLCKPLRGGFERWGVLRMDVDNLGKLFRTGLGDKVSISRSASLSFALRLFFEGWIPELAKADIENAVSKDDLSPYLYLQYSGGDDLFVIGAWDVLPDYAIRIRRSLTEFAAGNPNITLSGGIALADHSYPFYQAAQDADHAEFQAKSYQRSNEREKDALSFLNLSFDWKEFEAIRQEAYYLADGIRDKRYPRSLLQTIMALDAQTRLTHRKGQRIVFGRWTWMAAYQMTRVARMVKPEYKSYIEQLRDRFMKPSAETEALGLAARWAQYLTRGG